ncbi:glycoside hydrolase family 92 protein [Aureibaculum marinum]|uniref:Glycoside hydrolase family 92 protein n=2 Tax=Pseudomonadati TaxID=3379134 RepID=A0A3N4NGT5_9FLAO|nr:GH92 family glycosyl hydrolase [Aureibaculum marinum]RPD90699.1 glycoside hydrolase family 92 protein [Aureibaculum marinum]
MFPQFILQKKEVPLLFICTICFSFLLSAQRPVDYVNPFIGTSNFGATNPGAIAPRGMVSISPFNVAGKKNKLEKDSQWLSNPYVYENEFLTGFSHVNLSGVGCPDLGVIITMPTVGNLETNHLKYGTTYKDEIAKAGYYSTVLDKSKVKVETTATTRAGISRYHFPAGKANILVNLGLGLTNEQGGMIKTVSSTEIEGFRTVGSFCYYKPEETYPVYFVVKVDIESDEFGVWKKTRKETGVEAQWMGYNGKERFYKNYYKEVVGDSIGGYFSYNFDKPTKVEVKVGVSYISIENARENLQKEIADSSFLEVYHKTQLEWNRLLSKISVEGGTKDDKTVFYTALYHTLIHPNTLNDTNGEYPKMGTRETLKTEGTRFTVFSFWDTYRNLHSLMSLVYPDQQLNMVNSMLAIYDESGWLPKWELNSTETTTMVGDPAGIVLADTYLRGIRNFDVKKAYEAMIKSADQLYENPLRPGIKNYIEKGYLTTSDGGSVSTTQEYNISDFAIAQLAKTLGKKEDEKRFRERSISYRKLFDKDYKLLRPKNDDGSWHHPFNPTDGANFAKNVGFIEGNSWQYSFMVSHDTQGLIKLMGGRKSFTNQLQKVFSERHFDMANEPDIAYPYLFNFVKGEEWRTQNMVEALRKSYFKNAPYGLPGNDDTGTMSAWVIFSMLGIYPVVPADPIYTVSTPVFDKITIELDPKFYNGRVLIIEKEGVGSIKEILLNGEKHKSFFINHLDLVNGNNKLKFILE